MTLIEILKQDLINFRKAAANAALSAEEKSDANLSARALQTVIGRAEQRRKSMTDPVTDAHVQAELKSLVDGLVELHDSLLAVNRLDEVAQVKKDLALYQGYRPAQASPADVNLAIDELLAAIPQDKRSTAKGAVMPALVKRFGRGQFDAAAASAYLASKLS